MKTLLAFLLFTLASSSHGKNPEETVKVLKNFVGEYTFLNQLGSLKPYQSDCPPEISVEITNPVGPDIKIGWLKLNDVDAGGTYETNDFGQKSYYKTSLKDNVLSHRKGSAIARALKPRQSGDSLIHLTDEGIHIKFWGFQSILECTYLRK